RKRRERGIDFPDGADVENPDLQPRGANSRFQTSQCKLGTGRIGRIDEHSNTNGPGHQLTQEFEPLCDHLDPENIDSRQVAARPGEAGDETKLDRVVAGKEDEGIVVVAALAANAGGTPPIAAITATCRRTNSVASAGSRSIRSSAQRYSMTTFSPSTKPA